MTSRSLCMRSFVAVMALLTLGLGGCGTQGSHPIEPMQTDIDNLLAPDGLYTAPELVLDEKPSLYTTAVILDAAPDSARPQPDRSTLAALESQRDQPDSVWGNWAWIVLSQHTQPPLDTAPAEQFLVGAWHTGGYFAPPATGSPPTVTQQLGWTYAALSALSSLHSPTLTAAQRAATAQWLHSITSAVDSPFLCYEWSASMRALGEADDSCWSDAARWLTRVEQSRQPLSLPDAVFGLYGLVRLSAMRHEALPRIGTFWSPALAAAQTSTDVTLLAAAYSVAQATRDRHLNGLAERLAAMRLADGVYQQSRQIAGDLRSTFLVAELAGPNFVHLAKDALTAGLRRTADDPRMDEDPGSAALLVALSAMTGVELPNIGRLRAEAKAARDILLPRVVDETVAEQWAMNSSVAAMAGINVDAPRVQPWPLRNLVDAYLAAVVIDSFADIGKDPQSTGFAAGQLWDFARSAGDAGEVRMYLTLVTAYLNLHGRVTAADLAHLQDNLRRSTGCPRFPHLLRAIRDDTTSCDVQTTIQASRLISMFSIPWPSAKT